MKKQNRITNDDGLNVAPTGSNAMLGEGTVILQQAVWNGKHYEHFGISKELAYMYGHKANEVSNVDGLILKGINLL